MPYYRQVGEIPRKRHIAFRDVDGHRFHEELMGQEGFSSRSALLYHRHTPSAITAIEAIDRTGFGTADRRPSADASPSAYGRSRAGR